MMASTPGVARAAASVDLGDRSSCDGGLGQGRMRQARIADVRGVAGGTAHLERAVDPIDRITDKLGTVISGSHYGAPERVCRIRAMVVVTG